MNPQANERTDAPVEAGPGEVYAQALFEAAEKSGRVDEVAEEFASLVADLLPHVPGLDLTLASTTIAVERRESVLHQALAGRCSELFLNFLKTLVRRDRFAEVRPAAAAFAGLVRRHRGRRTVEVETAIPLTDDLRQAIAARVRDWLRCEPELIERVRPELTGGLVLRVGDRVYDGSVASQLKRLRAQLIEKSNHEIQSGRDRFRHSQ